MRAPLRGARTRAHCTHQGTWGFCDARPSLDAWNVENLFAPDSAAGPDEEQEYAIRSPRLAAIISAAGVSAIALQEVGEG